MCMLPSTVYPLQQASKGGHHGEQQHSVEKVAPETNRGAMNDVLRKRRRPSSAVAIQRALQQQPAAGAPEPVGSRSKYRNNHQAAANDADNDEQSSSSHQGDEQRQPGHCASSSSRSTTPQFRPIAPSALAASRAVMPQHQQFLVFIKLLLHQLQKEDPQLKPLAQARLHDCILQNRRGHVDYQNLQQAAQQRLLPLVGPRHWNRSVQYLTLFLQKQQQLKLQQAQAARMPQQGEDNRDDGPANIVEAV